ncbi:MAG: hypothetical protein RLY95_1563 [Pseudomonadota bacterium]|jgi:hypothetical protein
MSQSEEKKTAGNTPVFDPVAFQEGWRPAEQALLRRLKSIDNVAAATTTKQAARERIFGDEKIISKLLANGVSQATILADYVGALPHIPKIELQLAMEALRKRRSKTSVQAPIPVPQAKPQTFPRASSPSSQKESLPAVSHTGTQLPAWADGSDRLAGETDEEYAFRKSIEGDPAGRAKFIGEKS